MAPRYTLVGFSLLAGKDISCSCRSRSSWENHRVFLQYRGFLLRASILHMQEQELDGMSVIPLNLNLLSSLPSLCMRTLSLYRCELLFEMEEVLHLGAAFSPIQSPVNLQAHVEMDYAIFLCYYRDERTRVRVGKTRGRENTMHARGSTSTTTTNSAFSSRRQSAKKKGFARRINAIAP
jgi:hypothetical protein